MPWHASCPSQPKQPGGNGALNDLFVDVRHALRGFGRQPLLTATAVVSMALGIAANTAVFTLVDQVVLRQLPVVRPGELVQVAAPGTERTSASAASPSRCGVGEFFRP